MKVNIIILDNIHSDNFRYKKYMVLDPLGVVSGTRGEGARIRSDTATSSTPALQDAPTTLQVGLALACMMIFLISFMVRNRIVI